MSTETRAGAVAGDPAYSAVSQEPNPTDVAKETFLEMLKNLRNRKYEHIDPDERDVYMELMEDLDNVQMQPSNLEKFWIVVEVLVFYALTAALIFSLTVEGVNRRQFLNLKMWQWVLATMAALSGFSVVRILTGVVCQIVNWWWRIEKYAVYFTRRLKRSVDFAVWFCLLLLVWYAWFRPMVMHADGDISVILAHQLTRFLIALCLGSGLWVFKNVVYLKLEADLYYDKFFNRITKGIVYLHAIRIIHGHGEWRFFSENRFRWEPKVQGEAKQGMKGKNICMDVTRMRKESAPIWILRRLAEEYLHNVEHIKLPIEANTMKDDQMLFDEVRELMGKLTEKHPDEFEMLACREVQHLLSRVFVGHNLLVSRDRVCDIVAQDLRKYEVDSDQENQNKDLSKMRISQEQFVSWTAQAYRSCWGLKGTLKSSRAVFVKLDRLMSVVILAAVFTIWMLIAKFVTTEQLALLFTPFLAASFIFSDSCKELFQGLVFAFAMHPFNVGDRVVINGAQMRVKELNILTSGFYKYETQEDVIYPNTLLDKAQIINLDTTPDQSDCLEFTIPFRTRQEDIMHLELKIKKFVGDHTDYARDAKMVTTKLFKNEGAVKNEELVMMKLHFKHLVSYLPAKVKAERRSEILAMIMEFLKEIEVNNHVSCTIDNLLLSFSLASKVKFEQIRGVTKSIMRCVKSIHREHCKVVMVPGDELTEDRTKIALHIGNSSSIEDAEKDEIRKNLDDILERDCLKEHVEYHMGWPEAVHAMIDRNKEKAKAEREGTSGDQ